ncbi:RNA-binding S4 domain-containing protein [Niameybacter massiliensis]|uniref:RQC P-site tRNA stabilizing factor n=1 Tax=Holtiella tumoricola TaxID=3018743 RepID=A0AA42DNV6_9FIRM|nr:MULTISPECIES: RNA-binding S4 domain-containing protein [Lachnospirales]MDA3732772.1 RNA-binding S4 domain-containing protein [Holtiella tumoricola]
MRIDKYLKLTRIIKRRTIAQEACDQGRVSINDKVAKASTNVNMGDIIQIQFGEKLLKYEVLDIKEHVKKEDTESLYRML